MTAVWGFFMNGIQKIIDRIEADAAAERAQIIAEAEARCAEIEAQYAEAAQSEYQKVVDSGEKTAAQRLERRTSVAAIEAKKQVLATKQEMVQAAFERAITLLSELPDGQYVELLARLVSEASRTGNEILTFSARDTARVGEAVKDAANALLRRTGKTADLKVSTDPRTIRGGVIVTCGDIETNCSLDALVSRERNALSGKVADMLFS
jgi:V/A-type H+-transporting ATPase subunit E